MFFKCVSGLPFVGIDFGRIAMVKNISCIASLCCLSFIKHIYSETWCSVLCIFYSRCLYALYGVVSVSCESTYTFVIYIYMDLFGFKNKSNKLWSLLLFHMVWSCGICRLDLPIGVQYTWRGCPIYMWRWCPILGRWVHVLEIWQMACHPICVVAASADG